MDELTIYVLNPQTQRITSAIIVTERRHSVTVLVGDDVSAEVITVPYRNVRTEAQFAIQRMIDVAEEVLA